METKGYSETSVYSVLNDITSHLRNLITLCANTIGRQYLNDRVPCKYVDLLAFIVFEVFQSGVSERGSVSIIRFTSGNEIILLS
jgi:hypothetical protein